MANKTRKSLAFVSSLSLGIGTALVGFAPAANAVDPVSLEPLAGTSYSVSAAEDFQLKALFTNAAVSGGPEVLKFRVVDADAKLLVNQLDGVDQTGYDQNGNDAVNVTANAGDVKAGALDADDKDVVVATALTDGNEGTAAEFILVPAADATFSVTVQAWMDFDGDGAIDADEYKSPVRTVNFIKSADISYSVSLTAPALGDASLVATVASSPAVSAEQSTAVTVAFGTYAAATNEITAIAPSTVGAQAANNAFNLGIAAAAGKYTQAVAVTNATYVVQAMLGANPTGQRVYFTVADSDANDISAVTIAASADAGTGADALDIRTNKSVTFQATVDDTAGAGGDPVAGAVVTFTFTETHADADAVITVGGKSISNGDAATTVTAVTDAKGVASVTASFSGFAAGDNFMTVAAKVADVAGAAAIAPDFVDTAFGNLYAHNTLGTGAILKVTEGSTYGLAYSVLDNFGELINDSGWRVKLSDGGAVLKTATLSTGVASFSVTDDADVAETWTATVEIYNAANANWGNDVSGGGVAITPTVGTSNAASALTLAVTDTWAGGTDLALNLNDLSASDTRLAQTAPTLVAGGNTAATNVGTLSGIVTDASGAATYGSVTLSAPGVLFKAGEVTTLGSITVQTSAAGAFGGVSIYSNTSGEVTVTATSGSASKTLDVTFAAAGDDTEANVALSVSGNEPGKTMTVSGVVTDKYGNAVAVEAADFSVTYTGPGFIVGSLPTSVDSTGKFEFKVLLGSKDVLSGAVSVETAGADGADLAGDTTAQQADNVTATLSLVVAPISDSKVNAGSFKGYVAIYAKGHEGKRLSAKVGKDWVVVPVLASNFVRVVEYTGAGYTISVRIYIDRVLVDTIVVTTK